MKIRTIKFLLYLFIETLSHIATMLTTLTLMDYWAYVPLKSALSIHKDNFWYTESPERKI